MYVTIIPRRFNFQCFSAFQGIETSRCNHYGVIVTRTTLYGIRFFNTIVNINFRNREGMTMVTANCLSIRTILQSISCLWVINGKHIGAIIVIATHARVVRGYQY